MPSNIADFVCEADGYLSGSGGVAGIVGHATFSGVAIINGYRLDVFLGSNEMRLFRADAGVLTPIAATVPVSGYYAVAGNPVTYHMTFVGSFIDCWMSASGQADSAHISATDGTYTNGRVALLSFQNVLGSGGPTDWRALRITWT
jgi:hypothetical protein